MLSTLPSMYTHSLIPPAWHTPHRLCGGALHQTSRRHHPCAARNDTPSIREFITNETPVRGLDGTWRERPKDATVEAACIPLPAEQLPCPGARRIFRVDDAMLDQIVLDGGKAIIYAFEPGSSPAKLLVPPRGGSYAMLAQALGVQRMPGSSGFVRLLVLDRVAVQAMSGSDNSRQRALAAPLADRWAYFVRCAAVADAALDVTTLQQYGAEVATALGQCRDVAAEIVADLMALATMTAQIVSGPPSELRDLLMEDEEEAQQLLDWALQPAASDAAPSSASVSDTQPGGHPASCSNSEGQQTPTAGSSTGSSTGAGTTEDEGAPRPSSTGSQLTMEQMWRLSFAPLATTGLPEALGMSMDQLQQERLMALAATDVGMRMEQAAQQAAKMRARMAALMAVQA